MDERRLEIAIASTDLIATRQLAGDLKGTAYCDEREEWRHLPFRALATVVTDDPDAVVSVADVGLYVICRRVVKSGPPSLVALFPLVRRPGLTHQQADAHWRDVHAPLALEHHGFMTHYSQLSVVHRISGLDVDGFAICAFEDLEHLRNRFFSTDDGPGIIAADVANFADTERSPRRLVATETRFGPPRL